MVEIINLEKEYIKSGVKTAILNNITLKFEKDDFNVIRGVSGSGKSTLLNIIASIDGFNEGKVIVDGINVGKLSKKELSNYRKNTVGYITQNYNLIMELTVRENLILFSKDQKHLEESLDTVKLWGLEHILNKYPQECSGGQQQRASILSVLSKGAKILLCDEPTAALDTKSRIEVLEALTLINKTREITIILVTHDNEISKLADREIHLVDGIIMSDKFIKDKSKIEDLKW